MPQPRPVSVTTIGWFWTFIGMFYCFGGLSSACVVSNPAIVEFMKEARPGAEPAWRFGLVLLGVLGGFVWYSGVSFLRLRAWARTSIETISWLALVTFLGIGVYVITFFIRQPEVFFAGWGSPIGPALLVMCGTAAVVLIVMIGFLRGTTIREAFHGK